MSTTKRILLVDDDEFVLTCIKRILERRFDLEVALGANAALEVFAASGPFAVVVTDLRMPGMSGIELLAQVRQLSPPTIGLLLSGESDCQQSDDALRNGTVFRLVEKPCDFRKLIQTIEEALARYEIMVHVAV